MYLSIFVDKFWGSFRRVSSNLLQSATSGGSWGGGSRNPEKGGFGGGPGGGVSGGNLSQLSYACPYPPLAKNTDLSNY